MTCNRPGCDNPVPEERGETAKYCSTGCQHKRRTAPVEAKHCATCGDVFTPYKGDQKWCDNCRDGRRRERQKVTVPADAQMEKLIRYYQTRDSISIDDAPEGSKVVVLSDLQIPFVDLALEAARDQFIGEWQPDYIIYNGDCMDCYELSSFDKNPNRMFDLEDEQEQTRKMLRHHKSITNAKLYWIDGNHEDRLQRVIWKHAQGFAHMVKDLPEALELDKFCEAYLPYGKHIEFLGFIITHGTIARMHSAYTAKAMIDRYRSSGCSGHTHRIGSHSVTDSRGVSATWYECGFGARMDLEYAKAPPNWQQGFLCAVVAGGALHPQLVRVIETGKGRGFYAQGQYYAIKK